MRLSILIEADHHHLFEPPNCGRENLVRLNNGVITVRIIWPILAKTAELT